MKQNNLFLCQGTAEAHIHEIKPHLADNLRKSASYFIAKMSLVFKRKLISWIKQSRDGAATDIEETYRQSKGFYRYESIDDLKAKMSQALPLSVFQIKGVGGVWAALGRAHGSVDIVALNLDINSFKEFSGIPFFKCELIERSKQTVLKRRLLKEEITDNLLLFPFIYGQALVNRNQTWRFDGIYAFIYDNWDILTPKGKGIPYHSDQLFSVDVMD